MAMAVEGGVNNGGGERRQEWQGEAKTNETGSVSIGNEGKREYKGSANYGHVPVRLYAYFGALATSGFYSQTVQCA